MTNSGTTSKRVAEKFGFNKAVSDEADILNDKTLILYLLRLGMTRMELCKKGSDCFKTCFCRETTLLKESELNEIYRLSLEAIEVMIGFNRRFSPFAREIKKKLWRWKNDYALSRECWKIPADTWIQDLKQGESSRWRGMSFY